jgi:hypothetical protein
VGVRKIKSERRVKRRKRKERKGGFGFKTR